MKLLDKILFYLSVPKCVCCSERLEINQRALCNPCLKSYYDHKARNCSVCSRPLERCICPNEYLSNHYTKRLVKIFRYINREDSNRIFPSNMLIYSLKRDNRADVLDFLSDELSLAIKNNISPEKTEYLITSVPRRQKAVRKYGIDHAELLAKSTAKKLDIPYVKLLKSTAKSAQKKMHNEQRISNATFDYINNKVEDITGKRVIIIDDIVTTGASIGSSAMLIHALGAKEIIGAALSVAYKDKSTNYRAT